MPIKNSLVIYTKLRILTKKIFDFAYRITNSGGFILNIKQITTALVIDNFIKIARYLFTNNNNKNLLLHTNTYILLPS